ncbi:MAG: hypothetical protein EWV92_22065 [Microcystis aeruginosa Ma_MB_S_20031200_S102]|uniref:Uncharacterized protein n=1 Tax=Microcystis aeruginosa Ma_MB_S_20031200_S102 TaxID=2486254 RepID=A0A552E7V1_MICAE|nr:MAG: hypothetical protein EWV79_10970 [Microcystis aeruginosa Ma_MB_S_20031200_S102D]TRU30516.1 MAG: hypothetical protein EWV92_22065 [Microcystis aeruginosa Ma_MB_S_20031200_S102]
MKMKASSLVFSLVLGIAASTLTNSLPENLTFNSRKILAQDQAPSCPLPPDIAVTFRNSECQAVTLEKPQTFFRYYSDENSKKGRFLTTDQYTTNVEVIRNLALDQKWNPPNQATKVVSVTLPAGTTVYQGIVAPQNPADCYPGGGQQTFIKDSRDANIQWGEGRAITVTSLSCR